MPEQLASMLEGLDPENFPDNASWLELMMACHHATGGAAREEFADWSARDPAFAGDGEQVRARWDSLSAVQGGGLG